MKHMLMLIAGTRSDEHRAVFHTFAEALVRMIGRRQATARVRAVEL